MANALVDLSRNLADAVEAAGRSVVGIVEGGQHGVSGTLWSNGVVVAAEHTIRGRQDVTVVQPDGKSSTATIAGRDPGTDIAILKLANSGATSTRFGESGTLRAGNLVLAVGRRGNEGLATSYGVVSAVGGPWQTWHGARIDVFWRLDVLPFPGFSGGPLVDPEGRVLGINISGPRRSILTIPHTTVDKVVKQLLEKGHVARGYFGAGLQAVRLPSSIEQLTGEKREAGLLIVSVEDGGPAERAGVLVGDIVLTVGGEAVNDPADLRAALGPESVGRTVQVKLVRGGKLAQVSVTIGERPGRS